MTRAEAKTLTRAYITQKRKTDSKYGYYQLFEDIKTAMADDGFFELSGLAQTVEEMNKSAAEQLEKIQKEKSKK